MPNRNMKFVFRDGTNAPVDPINGYQVMDTPAEQAPGIEGDLLYTKNDKRLYLHNGTGHSIVFPQQATDVPPLNLVNIDGNTPAYNLSDADDILVCSPHLGTIIVYLHRCATAKVKKYDIKAFWYDPNVIRIVATGGDVIDVNKTEISITYPSSVTLVPLPGSPYWMLV